MRAALEPEVIGIDETATFVIEVRSDGLRRLRFRPAFELENFEIVGGPHQSEDFFRLVNGSLTSSFRVAWRLRPLATGKARVRSVVLQMRNETVRLRDREISVQEEPTGLGSAPLEGLADPFERLLGRMRPPWRPAPRDPAVFLRAMVEPERPFAGQQAVYTVYLYTRDDVSSIQPRELPTFRGFWVRDLPLPQRLPTEMVDVGGDRYGRVPLLQKALFPLRAGRSVLEPAEMDLLVRVLEPRFIGPPLARSEQVRLRTNPIALEVQPLPPAPAGFGGAVGQMSLAASIEPPELRMGEAATLTVTLSGRGNLQTVPEPRIEAPPGLTVHPPQQQGDEKVAGTTIQSQRTWSYAVIPDRAGRIELRVPGITYFDPQSRQYRSATAPPLAVRALQPIASSAPKAKPHPVGGTTPETGFGRLSWERMLPWLLALSWGITLAVLLARRRRPAFVAGSPPQLPTTDQADHRLREAAAEARPRQAAARIEEVWREHLAARWDIPSGTPSARWRELLAGRGADPAAADELVRLADDLHYLRYAPQLSATGELIGDAVSRSRRLLQRLR